MTAAAGHSIFHVSLSVYLPGQAANGSAEGKQQAARNASGRAFQRVVASDWLDKEVSAPTCLLLGFQPPATPPPAACQPRAASRGIRLLIAGMQVLSMS